MPLPCTFPFPGGALFGRAPAAFRLFFQPESAQERAESNMPNHVTTVCTVKGPDILIAAFRAAHIKELTEDGETETVFDFNTIIPMPACLNGTVSGSDTTIGRQLLTGELKREDYLLRLASAKVPYEQAVAYIGTAEAEGRKSLAAEAETGYKDWYEWCIACWGTKWGAYQYKERACSPGEFVFSFDTAWSFPEPIFRKLAEWYPGLIFDCASFDEGWNFGAVGQFNGRHDWRAAGELATDELYERVYGAAPVHEEEES